MGRALSVGQFCRTNEIDRGTFLRSLPDPNDRTLVITFCQDHDVLVGQFYRALPDDESRAELASAMVAALRYKYQNIDDIAALFDAVVGKIVANLAPPRELERAEWYDPNNKEMSEQYLLKFALQGQLTDDEVSSRGCYSDEGVATCESYLVMLREQYTRPEKGDLAKFEERPDLYMVETFNEIGVFLNVLAEGRAWIALRGREKQSGI